MTAPKPETIEKKRRVTTAAMFVLKGAGGKLGIVALNKALFYSDLLALRDTGATITGNDYLALPQGPVVASYAKRLVGELERLGWAKQLDQGRSKPLVSLEDPPFGDLDADQVDLLEQAGRWASNRLTTQLSDLSHLNIGWIRARRVSVEKFNGQAQKINLILAMQQLIDEDDDHEPDPWMTQPARPGEFDVRGAVAWE